MRSESNRKTSREVRYGSPWASSASPPSPEPRPTTPSRNSTCRNERHRPREQSTGEVIAVPASHLAAHRGGPSLRRPRHRLLRRHRRRLAVMVARPPTRIRPSPHQTRHRCCRLGDRLLDRRLVHHHSHQVTRRDVACLARSKRTSPSQIRWAGREGTTARHVLGGRRQPPRRGPVGRPRRQLGECSCRRGSLRLR